MATEDATEPLSTAPLPDGSTKRGAGRNLPLAIASGLGLAVLFVGTLLLNDWAFLTYVAAIVVVGLLEVDHAFRQRGLHPVTAVAVVAGLAAFYGGYVFGTAALSVALVALLFGSLAWTLADARRKDVVANLSATSLMTLWVPFCASFIGLLLARPDGQALVLTVIFLTAASDTGAYAVGSRFGSHRLAPAVSPAKTWEGLAGALVLVLLLAGLVVPLFVPALSVVPALLLGVVVVCAATMGDLAESLFKRDLGIKDLGHLLPGHGGIMDRVDAMLLTLPAAHLLLRALGI
jgi:phosphatidate cytidylyltransferase